MSTVFKAWWQGCCVRDCGWLPSCEMKLPKTFLVPLLQPLKRIRCHHVNDSARWGGNQRLFICSNVRGKNSSASGDAETEIFLNAEILKESERWLNTAWSARGLDKILDWKLMIRNQSCWMDILLSVCILYSNVMCFNSNSNLEIYSDL